ncbi:DUF3102 domain-containing protein [Mesorhizobium carmichaelinearum]|uniref:DUF3102 domain-containing protein n=1 Tax=Mesorhizobium carmichaelinearum TaxID=1208188 RepID=UPI000BA4922A|nr:DUF3102 domain-containing protein [Mesorhizobium carmichaelinearum]
MIKTETKDVAVAIPAGQFSYDALTPEQARLAKETAAYIDGTHKRMSADILEMGRRLLDVKASLGHGHFIAWVEAEFPGVPRTAQNYMLAAEKLGVKSEIISYLPATTLIEMAKAPDTVRGDILTRIDEAHRSAAPLPVKAVKSILSEAKEADEAARKEASKSPEARAREKARLARERKEREEWQVRFKAKQEETQSAYNELAALLLDRFVDDKEVLISVLKRAGYIDLSHRLTHPSGEYVAGQWIPSEGLQPPEMALRKG